MAKKRGKYYKTSKFAFDGLDARHYRTTEAYTQAVTTLFDRAAADVAANCANIRPGEKKFSFADYPSAAKHMQKVAQQLTENVTATITRGSRKEWLFACQKNDEFLNSIMQTSKLPKSLLKKMQDQNLTALQTFQQRKVSGMDLSMRVWKYVGDWKNHMEMALDVGLGKGTSAAQLARSVKQDLREPDRLFRRVRDKNGNLQLSKAAAAYHPGRGVYRSSVKNAQRLTRSEINMAYRESDFLRWQQLDFVVGFEIKRSNHRPLCKCPLCEKLKGKYPKTFKFVGWHPQCMCKAIPILMDDETFDANELGELRAALKGEEYHAQQAKNIVTDVPAGFREWMAENAEKQANWANVPYFVRDNFKNGKISDGLKIKLPTQDDAGKIDYHVPLDQLPYRERDKWLLFIDDLYPFDYDFEVACRLYGLDFQPLKDDVTHAYKNQEYWRQDEINAKYQSLKQALNKAIADEKQKAEHAIAELEQVYHESIGWIDGVKDTLDFAKRQFADEANEEYPNYKAINNAANGGSLDVAKIRAKIAKSKQEYNDAVQNAQTYILFTNDKSKIADLQHILSEKPTEQYTAEMLTADILAEINRLRKQANASYDGNKIQKKSFAQNSDVNELFKEINDTLPNDGKWFWRGDLDLLVTYDRGINGETNTRGYIGLKPNRLAGVKSALGKIGQGRPGEITEEEADAMATFWHEITHNRNKIGSTWSTPTQVRYMELANEYVARHTLPEFYEKLGVKDMPHKGFITDRQSTGYNGMVRAFQYVVSACGLDENAVLESAKRNLFELPYTEQRNTLVNALMDGGLKMADGSKARNVISLVSYIKNGYPEFLVERWLRNKGFIK